MKRKVLFFVLFFVAITSRLCCRIIKNLLIHHQYFVDASTKYGTRMLDSDICLSVIFFIPRNIKFLLKKDGNIKVISYFCRREVDYIL